MPDRNRYGRGVTGALPSKLGKLGHVTRDYPVDLSRPTPTLSDANLRYQDAPDRPQMDKRRMGP